MYAYAGGETALAQRCFFRARLLILTIHGEDHPYTATVDVSYWAFDALHHMPWTSILTAVCCLFDVVSLQSCLGLMLTEDPTGQFLKNALRLNISFFGLKDFNTALT